MLTETQFKVLMILFDDQGHAGWQLAEALGVEESNLNPLLKKLEKRNFIFQGPPRKSNRPKKPKGYKKSKNVEKVAEIEKREGDYKEFPYYIRKDLQILGSLIKEMVVTNKSYDVGFPFRVIRASNYMTSMRDTFKEDFNVSLTNIFKNLYIMSLKAMRLWNPLITTKKDLRIKNQIHFLNFKEEKPPLNDEKISKESLRELELWWLRYDIGMCFEEDPINIDKLIQINWYIPFSYILGDDIQEALIAAIDRMPALQRKKVSAYETMIFG